MSPIERSGGGGGAAAGGLTKLFTATLAVAAANIDTGANGIAAGHGTLLCYMVLRSAAAGSADNAKITLNGDVGANYDSETWFGNNATTTAATAVTDVKWFPVIHGNGGTANYTGVVVLTIPFYDKTTFNKVGTMQYSVPDGPTANLWSGNYGVGWRNTAAINQLTVTGNGVNLQAGSSVTIYGTE